MHINLPNGDKLVPDLEFLKIAGDVTQRTGTNWDGQGCPFIYIKNVKYRPLNEGLEWLASRIQRRNPPRRSRKRVNLDLDREKKEIAAPHGDV